MRSTTNIFLALGLCFLAGCQSTPPPAATPSPSFVAPSTPNTTFETRELADQRLAFTDPDYGYVLSFDKTWEFSGRNKMLDAIGLPPDQTTGPRFKLALNKKDYISGRVENVDGNIGNQAFHELMRKNLSTGGKAKFDGPSEAIKVKSYTFYRTGFSTGTKRARKNALYSYHHPDTNFGLVFTAHAEEKEEARTLEGLEAVIQGIEIR